MKKSLRTWLFLPVLLLTMLLVVAACESDDDDADDAGTDSDDVEQVEDTDDEATAEEEDSAATEDDDEAAEDDDEEMTDEDSEASEDDEEAADDSDDAEGEEEVSSDFSMDDIPDVNEALGGPISFGDFNWDSAMYHNRVAQYIIEEGYGHETDEVPGSTLPILQGLEDGDVHATMEMWVQNLPEWYHEEVEAGTYVDLGNNYDGAIQGWFVPTYVIEGDEERGIEPMAPDLESVDDLAQYWEVFQDVEDPEKGRIYNGIGGWEATEHNEVRLESYGLAEYYNSFLPGSEAALFTSLVREYEQGEPWIGYLWTPSWPFAQYDMTFIEEPEYNPDCWQEVIDATAEGGTAENACGFPEVDVNVVVSPEFDEAAPHLVEFLTNYESNMELTNAALLHISETDATPEAAAEWWLAEYQDVWTGWVPEEVAQNVLDSLE
ncbi:MAG: ABC transporter substrate-binding protein [Thermomicrobiaceae bacterium]